MPTYVEVLFYFYLYDEVENDWMDCDLLLTISIVEQPAVVEIDAGEEGDSYEEEDKIVSEGDDFFLLDGWPEKSEPILCSGTASSKNWVYQFPNLVEKDSKITLYTPTINKLLKFDQKAMTLTIIQNTRAEIKSGMYAGTLTV